MKVANPLVSIIGFIFAAALFAPISDAVAQQPPAVGNSVITGGPHDLGNGNYGWNIKTSDGTEKYAVTNSRGGIRRYVPQQGYAPPRVPPPAFESEPPLFSLGQLIFGGHIDGNTTVKRDHPVWHDDNPPGLGVYGNLGYPTEALQGAGIYELHRPAGRAGRLRAADDNPGK
jgi:hypothetical protein